MKTDIEIQGLRVELILDFDAPEGWGVESEDSVYRPNEIGETKRDYFFLENYIEEKIKEGEINVAIANDLKAFSEGEKISFRITDEDL